MSDYKFEISVFVGIIFLILAVIFFNTPGGIAIANTWHFVNQKVDDATNYDTIKKVEDTCRSMISSYESDKMTYEQYKDSTDKDEKSWSNQAKMRANKTAATYNNYILENNFVWKDNIPKDIKTELEYIE